MRDGHGTAGEERGRDRDARLEREAAGELIDVRLAHGLLDGFGRYRPCGPHLDAALPRDEIGLRLGWHAGPLYGPRHELNLGAVGAESL